MHKTVALIFFALLIPALAFNCKLPISCEVNNVHYQVNYLGNEKTAIQIQGIQCNIRDEKFQFHYSMQTPLIASCQIHDDKEKQTIEIRFHKYLILSERFNFTSLLKYGRLFEANMNFNFVNLKGFELDIADKLDSSLHFLTTDYFFYFNCIKCRIEFYSKNRPIKTCQNIIDSNGSIRSLFQISAFPDNGNFGAIIALFDPQFKSTICSLVFKNTNLYQLVMIGLTETFYKRNILTFENQTFNDLNSQIWFLQIKAENINIDSNLLNPSVFQSTIEIKLNGQVNTINGSSLNALKNLNSIRFTKEYFRDMIHKNGIKWMRDLNTHLNVNLRSLEELNYNYGNRKTIKIDCGSYIPEIRLSKLFPDRDFCLYKDFPFNQMVVLIETVQNAIVLDLLKSRDYTCTYLWLAQYFEKFIQLNIR